MVLYGHSALVWLSITSRVARAAWERRAEGAQWGGVPARRAAPWCPGAQQSPSPPAAPGQCQAVPSTPGCWARAPGWSQLSWVCSAGPGQGTLLLVIPLPMLPRAPSPAHQRIPRGDMAGKGRARLGACETLGTTARPEPRALPLLGLLTTLPLSVDIAPGCWRGGKMGGGDGEGSRPPTHPVLAGSQQPDSKTPLTCLAAEQLDEEVGTRYPLDGETEAQSRTEHQSWGVKPRSPAALPCSSQGHTIRLPQLGGGMGWGERRRGDLRQAAARGYLFNWLEKPKWARR